MDALITITKLDSMDVVSARELHRFLENKKRFTEWFRHRIEKYGLMENQDYVGLSPISDKPLGGRPETDYALTIDAAKELAMVEGNSKGKQARLYFIECEKQAKTQKYYTNNTPLPNFIRRYWDNLHNIDKNYFSVISELFTRLYSQLEKFGYVIPDKSIQGTNIMPDISVGKGFAKYLRENSSEFYNTHKTYAHTFPDGREVNANMYHIDALPIFIKYVNDKWVPENAYNYFKDKDPLALDYLPKLLGR